MCCRTVLPLITKARWACRPGGCRLTADGNNAQAQPEPGADDSNPPRPVRPGGERRSQLDLQPPAHAHGQQDVEGDRHSKQHHPARTAASEAALSPGVLACSAAQGSMLQLWQSLFQHLRSATQHVCNCCGLCTAISQASQTMCPAIVRTHSKKEQAQRREMG